MRELICYLIHLYLQESKIEAFIELAEINFRMFAVTLSRVARKEMEKREVWICSYINERFFM